MKETTIAIFALAMAQATAAIKTWDGGDFLNTDWADSTNWSANVAPLAGDSLVFPAIVSTPDKATNNNFAALTDFAGLAFSAPDYSVAGNEFDLVSGGIVLNYTSGTTTIIPVIRLTGAGQSFDTGIDKPQLTTGALNLNGNSLTLNGFGTVDIGGNIVNSVGTPTITKLGAGKAVLRGFNNFSGNLNVSAGTLYADGFFAGTGTITVGTSGILAGTNGGIVKATTVTGTVAPGTLTDGTTTLEFDSLGFVSGAGAKTLDLDIQGTVAGDTHDRITISPGGSITLNSATLALDFGSFIPPIGTVFTLINNASASGISGTFTGIAQGASVVSGGQQLQFSYTGGTGNDFTATVLNRTPVANAQSVSTSEDTAVPVTLTASDANGQVLTYTLVSNPANGSLSGSGTSRTYTPFGNFNGADSFTFRVSDGLLTSNTATVSITVNPVNDPPTISTITDKSIDEDQSPSLFGFTIGDMETSASSLVISAASDNPTLVPAANVLIGGTGINRTFQVIPAPNQSGVANITLTVSDAGGLSASDSFQVTVNAVNDPPTITAIADQTISEDGTTGPLAFVIDDIETGAGGVTLTGLTTNSGLVSVGNIVFGGAGTNRTVTVTPSANATGSATITIRATDGFNITLESFLVTVTAVSDPPVITAIGDQTINEDGSTGALAFGISDPDQGSFFSVSAATDNPSLVPLSNIIFSGSGGNRLVTVTGLPDQSGFATITVTVSDGALSAGESFVVTVNPVNDTPTLTAISNPTAISEDAGLQTVSLTGIGTGAANEIQTLTVTAISGNPSLIPNPTVTYNSPDTNGSLSYTPVANASGSAIVTVTVDDGQTGNNLATRTFTVEVRSVNDPPTISTPADAGIDEDTSTGPIAFAVGSLEINETALAVIGISSNTGLIPNANIHFSGSGANRTVTLTPRANQFGTATITLNVSDGVTSVSTQFNITVNPVEDLPTITAITPQSINEDSAAGPLLFNVGDAETSAGSLVVSAASDNPDLVPDANIVIGGTGANRTATVTPLPNQSGVANISLVVSDGNGSQSTQFTLTVTAVNDVPTISPLVNVDTDEDISTGPISFTVADVDSSVGLLTVSGTSGNLSRVPNENIVFGGSGANRTVTITPAQNQNGSVTITLSVSDDNGGSSSSQFSLLMRPVNDVPTVSPIGNVVINEDAGTGPIPFTLTDVDSDPGLFLVTGSSDNVTLFPLSVVIGGSGSNRTATLTPAANRSGTATVTITALDNPVFATSQFTVTVNPVNDVPTISPIADVVINEDGGTGLIPFTVGDVETDAASLAVTGSSSNTALVPLESIVLGGSGVNRTLLVTPQPNQSGTATITLSASDGTVDSSSQFLLTVNTVNDLPVITPIGPVEIGVNANTGSLAFTISDEETASESLVVVGSSNNTNLVPNGNIVFGGSGANRTVTVTPLPNQSGTATILISANDGTAGVSTPIILTVGALERVWDGGGSDDKWTTPQNWVGDAAPPPGYGLRFPAGLAVDARNNLNDYPVGTSFGDISVQDSYTIGSTFIVGFGFSQGNGITLTGTFTGNAVSSSSISFFIPVTLGTDATLQKTGAGGVSFARNIDTNGHVLRLRNTNTTNRLDISTSISNTGGVLVESVSFTGVGLSGGNTYTGGTIVRSGNLFLGGSGGSKAVPGNLLIEDGTCFNGSFDGDDSRIATSAVVTLAGGSLVVRSQLTQFATLNYGLGVVSFSHATPRLFLTGNLHRNSSGSQTLPATDFLGPGTHEISTIAASGIRFTGRCRATDLAGVLQLTGPGDVHFASNDNVFGQLRISNGRAFFETSGLLAFQAKVTLDGGWLGGTGETGPVTSTAAGGTVAPGNPIPNGFGAPVEPFPIGTLTTGNLTWNATTRFITDFDQNFFGASGGMVDLLVVKGTISLGGAEFQPNPLADDFPHPAKVHLLINNDGNDPIQGTFNGLPEGATVTVGNRTYRVSYMGGDGNDFTATEGMLATGLTRVWSGLGTNNLFSNPTNWVGGVVPSPGDTLEFPASAPRLSPQNDLGNGVTFARFVFTGEGYVLGGHDFTLLDGIQCSANGTGTNLVNRPVYLGTPQTFSVSGSTKLATTPLELQGMTLVLESSSALYESLLSSANGPGTIISRGTGRVRIMPSSAVVAFASEVESGELTLGGTVSRLHVGSTGAPARVVWNSSSTGLVTGNLTVSPGSVFDTGFNSNTTVGGDLILDQGVVDFFFSPNSSISVIGSVRASGTAPTIRVPLLTATGGIEVAAATVLTLERGITQSGASLVEKRGAGTLKLGAPSAIGTLDLLAGTLDVAAASPGTSVRLNGGTLAGTGSVGSIITSAGGGVAPGTGATTGVLGAASVQLGTGSTLRIDIDANGHDQLGVSGDVVIDGGALSLTSSGGFTPIPGQTFLILNNSGTNLIQGSFDGLPEGGLLTAGTAAMSITYAGGDGNDVVLTATASALPPSLSVPGLVTLQEDSPVVFSSALSRPIAVNGTGNLQITILAEDGVLSLASTTGLTFISGGGQQDHQIICSGTAAAINAALEGLLYEPNQDFSGATYVSIVVVDGSLPVAGAAADSLLLAFSPVNDPLVISHPAAVAALEDSAMELVGANRIGLTDPDAGMATLQVTLSLNVGTFTFDGSTVSVASGGSIGSNRATITGTLAGLNAALATLTLSPAVDFTGPATLLLAATDRGNTGSGGEQATAASVPVTFQPMNDPPVNSLPLIQSTAFDTSITFSAVLGNPVSVTDSDAGGGDMQLNLTATDGSLTLGAIAGLVFLSGDGVDDAQVSIKGSQSALNAALDGMSFTPAAGFTGDAQILMVSDDLGNTGSPGPLTDTDTLFIAVTTTVKVWDGGGADDLWTTPANWVGDVAPLPGESLDFPAGAARLTNRNDFPTGTAFNRIRVLGGYNLGTLTNGSSAEEILLTGNLEFDNPGVQSGFNIPLLLAADRRFVFRNGGTVQITGAIDTNGHSLILNNLNTAATLSLASFVSGAGSVIAESSNACNVFFLPPSSNTYTGGTILRSGNLFLGGSSGSKAVPGNLLIEDGTCFNGSFDGDDSRIATSAVVTLAGGSLVVRSQLTQFATLNYGLGVVSFSHATPRLFLTGNLHRNSSGSQTLPATDFLGPGTHEISTIAASGIRFTGRCRATDLAGVLQLTGPGDVHFASNDNVFGQLRVSNGRAFFETSGLLAFQAKVTLDGGWLGGTGETGPVTSTAAGGTVAPGNPIPNSFGAPTEPFPIGTLTTGNLSWNAATRFATDFDQNFFGASGGMVDLLVVKGTVSLGGAEFQPNPLADDFPHPGKVHLLIDNDGNDPIQGAFNGLPEGGTVTVGNRTYRVSYVGGDGNDFTATEGMLATGTTRVWSGGGANNLFSNTANWVGGLVPSPGDTLEFPPATPRLSPQNDLGNGVTFARFVFTGEGYVLGGQDFTLLDGIQSSATGSGTNRVDRPVYLATSQTFSVSGSTKLSTISLQLQGMTLVLESSSALYESLLASAYGPGTVISRGSGRVRIMPSDAVVTFAAEVESGELTLGGTVSRLHVGSTGTPARAVWSNSSTGLVTGDLTVSPGSVFDTGYNSNITVGGDLLLDQGIVDFFFSPNSDISVIGAVRVSGSVGTIRVPLLRASGGIETATNTVLTLERGITQVVAAVVEKRGAGTLKLAASSAIGTLDLLAGTLDVAAACPATGVRLNGGTLAGSGSVGSITTSAGGGVAPGTGATTAVLGAASVQLGAGSTLRLDLGGITAGGGHDQLGVSGDVVIDGGALSLASIGGFIATSGQSFILIENEGTDAVSGTFAGLPEGSVFTAAGTEWLITYQGGSGNDVVITRQALQTALEAWRQLNFGSTANSGDSANDFDFDHDGLVNLVEFAFGLDPKSNSTHQIPQAQRVGNELVITFTPPLGAGGVTYGAEASDTLTAGDWEPVANTGTAPQRVFRVTIGPEKTKFMRLTVSDP